MTNLTKCRVLDLVPITEKTYYEIKKAVDFIESKELT